jgi:TonB family protein
MLEFKTPVTPQHAETPSTGHARRRNQPNQQRLMSTALVLLLGTLVFVLYRDRDFWFPDAQSTGDQLDSNSAMAASMSPTDHVGSVRPKSRPRSIVQKEPDPAPATPGTTITRTVLPPLEVEVVAGSAHRTIHPGSNSIQVDMDRGSVAPSMISKSIPLDSVDATPRITSNAAERVQVASNSATVVTHSVKPTYPTLARQMKVQGSVILEAMIGRTGLIEDLHVVTGPPILANAAKEAVRQWQFKPHYNGSEPVETQARITVNFTISTN